MTGYWPEKLACLVRGHRWKHFRYPTPPRLERCERCHQTRWERTIAEDMDAIQREAFGGGSE